MQIDGVNILDLYPLRRAAAKIPGRRPGKRVSLRTLQRWRTDGIRDGSIRLHTVWCGGQFMTCDAWVAEFMTALNSTPEHEPQINAPHRRTPGQRQRAAEHAKSELHAAGVA